VENLHVNFTILVHSPTKITSLFYPVSKSSYFCIYDTPLNNCYFIHQSYPFAHLTSFRRITKFTTAWFNSHPLPLKPSQSGKYSLQYLYWNRLSTVKASHTRYRAFGPARSWSRCTVSQPAGDRISHPPVGRLPLLSARPAVTFPAAEHHRHLAGTKLYCLVTEAHRCKQLA